MSTIPPTPDDIPATDVPNEVPAPPQELPGETPGGLPEEPPATPGVPEPGEPERDTA